MEEVDAVVVGAGAVGLAIARRLALDGCSVVVLEAADAAGAGVSSRSSEVIHAGIYYPKGSLKARLCVEGRRQLYGYCARRQVEVRRLGKFIVAADTTQLAALEGIHAAALANGVDDVEIWSAAKFHEVEPDVVCEAAIFSPSTGIFDSHGYVLSLLGDVEAAGGVVALRSPFLRGGAVGGGFEIEVGGEDATSLRCAMLVNAAGLEAPGVAHAINGMAAALIPRARYAQGAYFAATGVRPPFRHLIYPIPEPGGLGIHATLDLGGQVRFGPDVLWLDAPEYGVSPGRAARFYDAIRRYWPALPDGALAPAYAGVRPKISGPGEPNADFVIQGPADHGLAGLVNLFGIESPGLTSSLAIADHVALALLGAAAGQTALQASV